MYGLFYIRKQNDIKVVLIFKLKTNKKIETKETQIFDVNNIKNLDDVILSLIKNKTKHFLENNYKLFYRNIQNEIDLKNTVKELNINNEIINNPLVKISQMDLDINNITKVKFKKYERY